MATIKEYLESKIISLYEEKSKIEDKIDDLEEILGEMEGMEDSDRIEISKGEKKKENAVVKKNLAIFNKEFNEDDKSLGITNDTVKFKGGEFNMSDIPPGTKEIIL